MRTRAVYIYKTNFYEPRYKEFYSRKDLEQFLSELDFMKPHLKTCYSVGLPEFQLGSCLVVYKDGECCRSDIKWGPRFMIGNNISVDKDGHIFVDIAMDRIENGEILIQRDYKKTKLNKNRIDAIISSDSHSQIWPKCDRWKKTVFIKFLTQVGKQTLSMAQY